MSGASNKGLELTKSAPSRNRGLRSSIQCSTPTRTQTGRSLMMRKSVAALLVATLISSSAFAKGRTSPEGGRLEWVQATFLALDASSSRVTYRSPRGDVTTARVSSATALEKIAKMRSGQKVVLQCRFTDPPGEPIVEDAKNKVNWWKRGIILGVVVLLIVVTVGLA